MPPHVQQPWIGKPAVDIVFILLPPFACLFVIALFPQLFQNDKGMPDAAWVVLILLIDVAHVYSTLYRTYFDPQVYRKQKSLLLAIPFISFVSGVLLYSVSVLWFWRILAYVAIFHFIRQQYGFMRVYSRKEDNRGWMAKTDKLTIYYATLYPILYWHLSGPRNFNWFIEQDLMYFQSHLLLTLLTWLYYAVLLLYIGRELLSFIRFRVINWPRSLTITGTVISWYAGIVYFNGDMAFTLLNVVSHGIPYMALIWLFGKKTYTQAGKGSRFLQMLFSFRGLIVFIGLLFLFAFIEEGLWDWAVWQEHARVFNMSWLGEVSISPKALSFIVPLLALPQITHYILDGFIWKIKEDSFKWSKEDTK
ncbi:MAG: hypothetical protein J0M10_17040 [Chitinophagales bacterium]|nr:hypothetical protein [Chitinophagales bacterium]